ncbi:MAG: hypothetical protein U1E39_01815 [Planctomycetota bacterium]
MRRLASVAVVALVGLAACRGGVKSPLRVRETAAASEPAAPVVPPAPVLPPAPVVPSPPPSLTPPAVRPQVWRIEYYKISDG